MYRLVYFIILLISVNILFTANAFNQNPYRVGDTRSWPVLKHYDQKHTLNIGLPLGGIGTGTVSLSGRGALVDWEIMNVPSKGYVPGASRRKPFFALYVNPQKGKKKARVLEGSIPKVLYEGAHGSSVANPGFARFKNHSFSTAYPFGQVNLSDPEMPVDVKVKAFNPFIPGDADNSGIPVAVLQYEITNPTSERVEISVAGNIPNFIGEDGTGDSHGCKGNVNVFREGDQVKGLFMHSEGVDKEAEQWGTMALTTLHNSVSYRTEWQSGGWNTPALDFWDDFSSDGKLQNRSGSTNEAPVASLAVQQNIPANSTKTVTFMLTWHFPNRYAWAEERVGNYYTTQYTDAWDVAEKTALSLQELETKTLEFINAFLSSDMPEVIKEAALFNLSTLRTQTTFRIESGHFMGWEGCSNKTGCCFGSCTHVWNYEQATSFLFGNLAQTMREVEFGHATDEKGLMSFRVRLPLENAQNYGNAAADGQMGTIMRMYRDWKLSGNDAMLKKLWPNVRKALEFCWIDGGWDANKDGVMEGSQHNTMDVEYFGPNPQMQGWYLGALKATEKMARHMGEKDFAETCKQLFNQGSKWTDKNLFNGEYFEQEIRIPDNPSQIAKSLRVGMGAEDLSDPAYQLGSGCLVDQLAGQYFAHVVGLGYLLDKGHVQKTLNSIMRYNYRGNLNSHFNNMRAYALGEESALLMASYPKDRPEKPFPYFAEVMTGFEYTAAIGMLYEGQTENGLRCIKNIRDRYDGLKRNPFDEAECGHHYARAMASWASLLALSGFQYSGIANTMSFAAKEGTFFWSNGYSWGKCSISKNNKKAAVNLSVLHGKLNLKSFELENFGNATFDKTKVIEENEILSFTVEKLN